MLECYVSFTGADLGGSCSLAAFSNLSTVTLHHIGTDNWGPTALEGTLADGSLFECHPGAGAAWGSIMGNSLELTCIPLGKSSHFSNSIFL